MPQFPKLLTWPVAAALAGCAARSPAPSAAPAAQATAAAKPADPRVGTAIPFALCRSFGLAGTPCYPTNVDIGAHPVGPCRDRYRGTCEQSGVCQLAPVTDGRPCGDGVVCKDGSCVAPGPGP